MSTPNSLVLPVADGTEVHAYVAQPQGATTAPVLSSARRRLV
ncbi:hypothetical protein [Hymenobacter sp. BRD67]|nr:hypothetical protein [Hymenobacter sp. BRD67]